MIPPPGAAGPRNALTDVAGLRVGHHTAAGDGFLTGTTVVLAPPGGMVAGIDVRGGAPATHETDLLRPTATVERIDAIVLSGGSAHGLAACGGVADELEARSAGVRVGPGAGDVVPIVPGAALFDLGRGGVPGARPGRSFGRLALAAALAAEPDAAGAVAQGCVGAGTGALCGGLKGGVGVASVVLAAGITVAALVVVNAVGSPIDPASGELLGARQLHSGDLAGAALPRPDAGSRAALGAIVSAQPPPEAFALGRGGPVTSTTLAVVGTDAALTKGQCTQVAITAHDGLARALDPVHTALDGDLVFAVSTGRRPAPDPLELHEIAAAAAGVVTRAIVRGLLAACGTCAPGGAWPGWLDVVVGGWHPPAGSVPGAPPVPS